MPLVALYLISMNKSFDIIPSRPPEGDLHPENKPLHKLDSEFIVDKNPAAKREGKTVVSAKEYEAEKRKVLDFEAARRVRQEAIKMTASEKEDMKQAFAEANAYEPEEPERPRGALNWIKNLFS